MQMQAMATLGGIFALIYIICVIAIIIYCFMLLGRLVNAQERTASALEIIARKMREDAKP
jgi:flagellar biogenesis protein FliO